MRLDSLPRPSLRIAYVCTDPGIPVFGHKGGSIHVQEILRALLRQGHRPELFACRFGGPAPQGLEGVPLHPLPLPEGRNTAERERETRRRDEDLCRALGKAEPFDLVYQRYSLWSDGGMRFAKAMGIPGILEVNAPLVHEQARHRALVDREGAEAVTCSAFELADLLVAVSHPVGRWIGNTVEGKAERVQVISNGVDPSRFRSHGPDREGRRDDALTVGFVGSLKPWHGVDVLVEAFSMLVDGFPASLRRGRPDRWRPETRRRGALQRTKLLIVGDGPERDRIRAEVAQRGLGGHVDLVGAVPHDRIPGLLRRMDVAVAPYPAPESEGFYFSPLKILEYLAAEVPVVASRVGPVEEVITHGLNGLLTPPGDARALAVTLEQLRASPALRSRLARNGLRRVAARHTWDHVVDRILESTPWSSMAIPVGE